MNVPPAETEDTELRVLSEVELDDVNGGLQWTKTLLLIIAVCVALALR